MRSGAHRRKRVLLAAALAGPSLVWAGVPERVQALYGGLADHPVAVQRRAQAELAAAEARGDGDARYRAALRLALAAVSLEHGDLARQAAALVEPEVVRRRDDVAQCVLALVPEASDDPGAVKALQRLAAQIDKAQQREANWCVVRLQTARGQILDRLRRVDEAIEALQDALHRSEADGDHAAAASVQASLAWLYGRIGDGPKTLALAIEHGEAAVKSADRLQLRSLAAVARHNLAGPLLRAGRADEAHALLVRALALTQEVDEPLGGAYVARLLARLEEQRGRPREALALFRQAQKVFATYGDLPMEVVCRLGAMAALAALQDWNALEHELAAVLPLLAGAEDRDATAEFHQLTMQLKEARGDLAGALAAAKQWSDALQAAHLDARRRADADARERHESARKEAENARLRDQQAAVGARQGLLVVTLVLALALVGLLSMHGFRQHRLRQQLRERAERDDLTRLPNRRAMLDHAQQCLDDSRRLGRPVALAVLDLDHFKSVNDRYGHDVGDEALRCFAAVCTGTLRNADRMGRVGGEEFLGVFPDATPEDLGRIFERLRLALQNAPVAGMAADERLTFSMGAAFRQGGEGVEALMRNADQALYEAKAQGRDRLHVAA